MDKEHPYSIKKNKKKINISQIEKQKNIQNDVEEKFATTTNKDLITKDDNDNSQDLSNTYKNLDILISNKLKSLGNNQDKKQKSSNLIKKQNNLNNVNISTKQKNNFLNQPVLKLIMSKSHTEKSNETSNQSLSLLLNKDSNISKEISSISNLNKSKIKDSIKKNNIQVVNSSEDIRKKTIAKLSPNSPCSSHLSKNFSSKKMTYSSLFSHDNSNKIINNQILNLQKSEGQIKSSYFHEENRSQNKQKIITKKKKSIKTPFNKRLSKDNYNNYPNKIRTTKSLKTPKIFVNNTPIIKRKNNNSISSIAQSTRSNKNTDLNPKLEFNITPFSGTRSRFRHGIKRKIQRKKRKKLTFSNFMQEFNNNKNKNKKKLKCQTVLITNKMHEDNLYKVLSSNKPNKIKEASKIMDIITIDEMHKKIKESIGQYDKKELIKEIHDLETNDICEAIDKLPIMNNNSLNNKNEQNYSNNEDNNNNESNKTKYINIKKFDRIYNDSSKKKLMIFDEKFRKLTHKVLVYDSLDDEETEQIEINFFYIAPNSITVYLIDFIILISSLIQLLYLPIFLAYNLEFCRNFSTHQLMFYLIDLFYILDVITGFFRAYYNFDEFLIKNGNKICKNYLKNWFFIDCIEAIPLYIIFNLLENECKFNDINVSSYYNINKLQYILLIIKINKIFKVISTNAILKKIKKKLNDYDFFFEYKFIIFTIFILFSSLNISSCLFIFLGRNTYPGWIIECNIQNNSFAYIYLTSIYYLMTTVTTVGYGDITVSSIMERIYQIIVLIVGTCAYSYTVSYISNYIQKIQEKSINYEKKISILEDIKLSSENFTTELYDKIHRYLQYNRIDKKSNNEILIDCLPYPLNNNLFMEMYKNIIKNFKFFKSFENSNFIVKVVTSFKPVLTIKNDILVQEGDFIEDIIFVKEGILSLEVCIDLDNAQESIEAYLNEVGFGKSAKLTTAKINKKFETHLYSNKNSFNYNELKFNEISANLTKKKEINEKNKKYLKIVDIRKNEYYGDILMFLNERTLHRVKVKSKKAELFYLNKTDTIEISSLYPNIWKRIMQKSLFNMKQIKNLTRKILIYFSKLNGIFLDEEKCKDTNSSDSSSPKSKSNLNNDNTQIIENTQKSSESKNKEEESEVSNNINNTISSVIYEEENENENIDPTLTNATIKIKETSKRNTESSNFNNKTIKINNKASIKSSKNINNNNIENNKNLELKFNSIINQTPKENNIENSNNINQETEKYPISNNINSFSDYSDIKKYCSQILNENDINSEIYTNERLNDNKFLQSCCSGSNRNYIENNKEKNLDKMLLIDYMDKKIDYNDENEKKLENDSKSLKINNKKIINFENLSIVNTITTTISSCYENLNQISKYKFSRDMNLKRRTIQFLMEETNKICNIYSRINSNISPNTKINNPFYQYSKRRLSSISKHKVKAKNSNYDEEHPSMTSLSKDDFSEFNHQNEKNSSKISKGNKRYMSPDINRSKMARKNYDILKTSNIHKSMQNLYGNVTERLSENIKKKFCKRKHSMQNLSDAPEELNFYGKMKTMHGNNITTVNNNKESFKSPSKRGYLDMISHNILESRQTLNNPEEFYKELFANIVQKKFNKRKKSGKIKKEVKNKIRSNKYLFDSNDRGKIKNGGILKRPYSTSDIIN